MRAREALRRARWRAATAAIGAIERWVAGALLAPVPASVLAELVRGPFAPTGTDAEKREHFRQGPFRDDADSLRRRELRHASDESKARIAQCEAELAELAAKVRKLATHEDA